MTTKIDAVAFSWAGDKYLGRSYEEMDCQAFVEKCMSDCGLRMDLGGSNSWYREVMRNGWTGTPEECVRVFGQIPKGALLFILEKVGLKTPEKFRHDGIGDATHIGIKTGRGEGAIHSSYSRGCVAESKFKDKTIPDGGWNRVGLYDRFDYGKSVNWLLEHIGIGEAPQTETKKEGKSMNATVTAPKSGQTVNLRKKPDGDLVERIPDGTEAELTGRTKTGRNGEEWAEVTAAGKTGWMMAKFLIADDSAIPAEDPDDFVAGDACGDDDACDLDQDGSEKVALYFTVEELAALLPILEKAVEQIVDKVGRG